MTNSEEQNIAPCGMNCSLCMAYQREKNQCLRCNATSKHKPKHCENCVIKHCEELQISNASFCYECQKFPCRRLKQLDARYRKNYGMSMIDNLLAIKMHGITQFIEQENVR